MNENEKQMNEEKLCNAIKSFLDNMSNDTFVELLKRLSESLVIVPVTVTMSDEDTEQFLSASEDDTVTSLNNIRMKVDLFQNGETLFFPMFTSVDRMESEYRKHFSTLEYPFTEVVKMIKGMKGVENAVINPFTQPFVLSKEMIYLF